MIEIEELHLIELLVSEEDSFRAEIGVDNVVLMQKLEQID